MNQQSGSSTVRLILADDHPVVRAGLRQLIETQPDFKVVGETNSGRSTLTMARTEPTDVLLLDLALPDMSGLDVLKQLKNHHPELAVLVISGYSEAQYGVNVLRAGASGYIGKGAEATELFRAIRTVARGGRYVGPELASVLVAGLSGDATGPLHGALSQREFQIFCKLAEGMSVSQIAELLFLSVKTVSTYRARVLEKMNMKSNADMTYYAIKNDLLQ
jgi:two-component system invasion response regulator UvrY